MEVLCENQQIMIILGFWMLGNKSAGQLSAVI